MLFPPPELACDDGLLAVGGDLSAPRLLMAYRQGIFPWYSPGEPILWWAPDPRLVLFPHEFHLSRRLARTIRQGQFTVTFDCEFAQVITHCAQLREKTGEGTWIDAAMTAAYCELHELGYAHSVECRENDVLVGGLYGVALGTTFFGESMFSLAPNSSKVALATLVAQLIDWNYDMIDCQIGTGHLKRLGAREISGTDFFERLARSMEHPTKQGKWPSQPSATLI